jgi:lipoate---protein ligase
MIFIVNSSLDPFFNLSCEEYLLKYFTEECFMLWRNSPSVIVGKHQNTLSEINYDFINKNDIPVIRRLSGGGTVFHDSGNINFTFITNRIQGKGINFPMFLNPIVDLLRFLNIPAIINSRNNVFIGDNKISGTAAHLVKDKVIHHGTLLFKSAINNIDNALKINPQKYSDKSIKSVHSPVTNICNNLTEKMEIIDFIRLLEKKIKQEFAVKTDYSFQIEDIRKIESLVEKKYRTWDWNYGYSPDYKFNNSVIIENTKVDIELHVSKGIIKYAFLSKDISKINKVQIESKLIGQRHEKNDLKYSISHLNFQKRFEDSLIQSFF